MSGQTTIDFTTVLHKRENNEASQRNLDENKFHFIGQAAVVYSLLQKGVRLTAWDAMFTHKIGHLARRIGNLRAAGVEIKTKKIDKRGTVEYFMDKSLTAE